MKQDLRKEEDKLEYIQPALSPELTKKLIGVFDRFDRMAARLDATYANTQATSTKERIIE